MQISRIRLTDTLSPQGRRRELWTDRSQRTKAIAVQPRVERLAPPKGPGPSLTPMTQEASEPFAGEMIEVPKRDLGIAVREVGLPGAQQRVDGRDGRRERPVEAAPNPVSYTHLRAHETPEHLVCRLLL